MFRISTYFQQESRHHFKKRMVLPLALAVVLILPAMLFGATAIDTCGTVITTPGTYVLISDLGNCLGDGVDIQANNVNLQLRGHVISGPGGSVSAAGVVVGAQVFKNVTILGPGTIINFDYGVSFQGTAGGSLIGVNLASNVVGLFVCSSESGAAPSGLLISANNFPTNYTGVFVTTALNNSTLIGNTLSSNGAGMLFAGSNNVFIGNVFFNSSGNGFSISSGSGNSFRGNQFENNGGDGIVLASTGNHLTDNVALGNGRYDIEETSPRCSGDTFALDAFTLSNQACVK